MLKLEAEAQAILDRLGNSEGNIPNKIARTIDTNTTEQKKIYHAWEPVSVYEHDGLTFIRFRMPDGGEENIVMEHSYAGALLDAMIEHCKGVGACSRLDFTALSTELH